MELRDVFAMLDASRAAGDGIVVEDLAADARRVRPGSVFCVRARTEFTGLPADHTADAR